ncbi:DNA-methyltransferase [Mycobacteroides franklinii]|uniref:Methyltransferase n=1 Tax=Mycobacteroides franklinii TaxID=948102 RepID=A0A4R5PG44_9MYCO|nr:site-specific DNA-methyltransferase [Mycobacteroides franklinii]ORA57259.1 site-specific DNA-methyltransferase [Mycobacteroides franklinii]TDH25360.1 site-specific DNA-methyltransferase [Mycobacteroides franklinii]
MTAPYYQDHSVTLYHGDALEVVEDLPDGAVDCIVTSPPYFGLRDYGEPGQYGLESSPAEYVEHMRTLFAQLRRALADDGTLWLNLGDSYSGGKRGVYDHTGHLSKGVPAVRPVTDLPGKNLIGIPWRVAFALQDDGWYLRNDNIWSKPNTMPESVNDRLSSKHEYVFMLTKSRRYFFDLDAIREPVICTREAALSWARDEQGVPGQRPQHRPGRAVRPEATPPGASPQTNFGPTGKRHGKFHPAGKNPGDVWEIATQPFPGAHFATMPPALAQRCIAAGCKPGGTVLDPFSGSGTTGMAAQRLDRKYVGIDLNRDYLDLSLRTRFGQPTFDFEAGA